MMKKFFATFLVFASVLAFAGDKKTAATASEPSALTEFEQVKLENAKLKVSLAQAQAQLRAAPMVCESSREMDNAQALVSDFEKNHGAPGYHFDFQSGAFVKNPEAKTNDQAKKDEQKK